jgi:rSAM/selenodomain-associated transferase 1
MSWFDAARPRGTHPDAAAAQLIVIAKEPRPGRVKTRLTPPFTPQDAASLAEGALTDTLAAAAAARMTRHVLALDGAPGDWLPAGFDVIGQRGGGLDQRLAAAFADTHARLPLPMVLIGMDTPQVTPGLLTDAAQALACGEADAVFGPAADGGFWLLGLRKPDRSLLAGVPMSRQDTGRHQLDRLTSAGLRVAMMPELTDVDTVREAELVAAAIPGSRFAAAFDLAMAGLAPAGVRPARGRRLQATGPWTVTSVP